ncbi:MAG: MASE1 domain-containing protein, partial [Chloroflexi bacterium]|nr:MASE1 domain-containing protein [Chloroflexota bacterium]
MNSKKKPNAPHGAAELHRNPRPLLRLALIVAVYLIAFIILDLITKQFEVLPGIVMWYPPAGLTYTLLLVFGVRFAPAVTIALFISNLFIYRMPQPPYLLLLWAFIMSLIYSFTAAFLRHRIHFDWHLRKLRDVVWFVFTTIVVSALLAVLSVSSSALSSAMPRNEVLRAIFDWWIGETVGVLTITPFLLIYVMPGLKRFAEGQLVRLPARRSFTPPTLSTIGQAASIVLTLYLAFGTRVLDEFHPLFLLALPLIWIALQRGFKGVSTALLVLNSGVVLALWLFRFDLARLGELELLMIVNCIVGLLMGAVVSERKQADQALQASDSLLQAAVNILPVGLWIFDAEGKIVSCSAAAKRIWAGVHYVGLDQLDEYKGWRTDSGKLVEAHEWAGARALEKGETTIEEEVEIECFDGTHKIILDSAVPLRKSDGSIGGAITINQDISERKQAEEELRESEERFRSLYENTTIGMYRTTSDGQVLMANPALIRMLGYDSFEEFS